MHLHTAHRHLVILLPASLAKLPDLLRCSRNGFLVVFILERDGMDILPTATKMLKRRFKVFMRPNAQFVERTQQHWQLFGQEAKTNQPKFAYIATCNAIVPASANS